MTDDGRHFIGTARSRYLDTQVGPREVNRVARGDEQSLSGNLYCRCRELGGFQAKTDENPLEFPFPHALGSLFFHEYPIKAFQFSLVDLGGST